MSKRFIEIDLTNAQKAAVLEYTDFFISDKETRADLLNKRKKWIRFSPYNLSQIIGELSYYFNRCKGDDLFYFLDELISHLEFFLDEAQ